MVVVDSSRRKGPPELYRGGGGSVICVRRAAEQPVSSASGRCQLPHLCLGGDCRCSCVEFSELAGRCCCYVSGCFHGE